MGRIKRILMLLFVVCMMVSSISAQAADERLGTIVDGSLLTDETEVELHPILSTKGTYLTSGSGKLTILDTRYVNAFGRTSCHRTCDEVKVTIHLQRLVGNTWSTIAIAGPTTAYNTDHVTRSQDYRLVGGSYYRISCSHTAIKGDTAETVTSASSGIWVSK